MLAASRTADSAQSALRLCASARPRISATRSLVIFEASVSGRSSPPEPTTDAAPIVVCGAMAATSPARVMNVAADAAWAPDGVTQVITGMELFRMAFTIRSVLVSSPPGESISIRTATAPSSDAAAMPSSM